MKLDPRIKTFVTGLGVAALVVLGTALIQLNASNAIDWTLWLHSLIATEAGAVGQYIVSHVNETPKAGP